jgi:hypothetical protein
LEGKIKRTPLSFITEGSEEEEHRSIIPPI